MREVIEQSWRQANFLTVLLWPLSLLYRAVFALNGFLYRTSLFKSYGAPLPVIVVGNLTVGGTGKTPLVIYLVQELRRQGYTPGVISRGYGGRADRYPLSVKADTPVSASGDEPALIVRRTSVPMVVSPNRKAAIEQLIAESDIDVIVSDDGLQHLAMQRDIEICLQDAMSSKTNTFLLPAGPYRERLSRLSSVDIRVTHGLKKDVQGEFSMQIVAGEPLPVNQTEALANFNPELKFEAVAGIGNPQRFFNTCEQLGYQFTPHSFADHHAFSLGDLDFGSAQVLMTEKDAVKCQQFADGRHWYLPIDAKLSNKFNQVLATKLAAVKQDS